MYVNKKKNKKILDEKDFGEWERILASRAEHVSVWDVICVNVKYLVLSLCRTWRSFVRNLSVFLLLFYLLKQKCGWWWLGILLYNDFECVLFKGVRHLDLIIFFNFLMFKIFNCKLFQNLKNEWLTPFIISPPLSRTSALYTLILIFPSTLSHLTLDCAFCAWKNCWCSYIRSICLYNWHFDRIRESCEHLLSERIFSMYLRMFKNTWTLEGYDVILNKMLQNLRFNFLMWNFLRFYKI